MYLSCGIISLLSLQLLPHEAVADSKIITCFQEFFSELHNFTLNYFLDFCPWLLYLKTELFILCPPKLPHQNGLCQHIPGNRP